MEIKTRYNIGQKVWYNNKNVESFDYCFIPVGFTNTIEWGKISGIFIRHDNRIYYMVEGRMIWERNLYSSYFEAKKSEENI